MKIIPTRIKKAASKVLTFTKEVATVVKDNIVEFGVGIKNHWESTTLLIFADFGLCALLEEVPFYVVLPLWVESSAVVPVVATLIIFGLVWLMKRGYTKRNIASA